METNESLRKKRRIYLGNDEFQYCFGYHLNISINDYVLIKNKEGKKIWLQIQFMGNMIEENRTRPFYLQFFVARIDNLLDSSFPYQYNDQVLIHYAQIEEHKTFHDLLNFYMDPQFKS